MSTPNWITKLISRAKIKLTEKETKVESIINLLLSKPETTIRSNIFTNGFIISNQQLDFHLEVEQYLVIVKGKTTTSDAHRLTVLEHFKSLIAAEESRRYKDDKQLIFRKSISQLDEMLNQLNGE